MTEPEISLEHDAFVKEFSANKLDIIIDAKMAKEAIKLDFLPIGFKEAMLIFEWLWLLLLITAFVLLFYKWWLSIILLLLAFGMPASLKLTARKAVRDELLKNSKFYDQFKTSKWIKILRKA